jgi:hypothetical protein
MDIGQIAFWFLAGSAVMAVLVLGMVVLFLLLIPISETQRYAPKPVVYGLRAIVFAIVATLIGVAVYPPGPQ